MQKRMRLAMWQVLGWVPIAVLLIVGCSGGHNPGSPVDPGAASVQAGTGPEKTGSKALWGYWDVTYEKSRGFVAVPMRQVQYTVNVNSFLQPPAGSLSNMNVNVVNDSQLMTTGRIIVDVSLSHPLPGNPEYAGFDVLGIFMHSGGLSAQHDASVRYAKIGTDAILSNADGYTRWMNKGEFPVSGVGGYTEGALGTKGISWNATVNPYKYFADGLSTSDSIKGFFSSSSFVDMRGVFKAGSTNTRRYDLTFPKVGGVPDARFQYAVVASWVDPLHIPPTTVPGDFPNAANMKEALFITADPAGSTAYWNSASDRGGNLQLTLEIWDEGARTDPQSVAGEVSQIIVESPNDFIPGSHIVTFTSSNWVTSAGSSLISQRFTLDCGAVMPQGPNPSDNPIFVAVQSINGNYDPGVGTTFPSSPLRAFQRFAMPVTGGTPPPTAPPDVSNFQASDGDTGLPQHQVKLTWTNVAEADTYTIQRYDYNTGTTSWSWTDIYMALAGQTSYTDTNARYSGPKDAIQYRIRAENTVGTSPGWSTDTGYPKARGIFVAFWCVANDTSGTNAVVPFSRAQADYADCKTFWNQYGFDMTMKNTTTFFWITDQQYRQLSGSEDQTMHATYGKAQHPDSVNIYYVESAFGDTTAAYTVAMCPGSSHNTTNIWMVLSRDTRGGNSFPIIMAHESGHAMTRFWDMYLLDLQYGNNNGVYDAGDSNCSANTWCTGPAPFTPPMYCDVAGAYAGDLMWYSYSGQPVSYYDLSVGQYIAADGWMRAHEGSYPIP